MLGQRHMQLEVEMLKWLAAVALAAVLALTLLSRAIGGELTGTLTVPGLLPPGMDELATPLDESLVPARTDPSSLSAADAQDSELPRVVESDPLAAANARLWAILELHRQGRVEEAIAAWNETELPAESDVWRYLALASAYLQAGDLQDALAMLNAAESLEPDNAVLHYYVGITRMQQAAAAAESYESTSDLSEHLVCWIPPELTPGTKSLYELAAISSLERAIRLAPELPRNRLLLGSERDDYTSSSVSQLPPMVHDLLAAIGADNYVGKSHNMLGHLYLERGWLEQSEENLDQAAKTGLAILYGYGQLGDRYALERRHLDACRSYLKQLAQGGPIVSPATKFLDNLRQAF